MFLPAGVWFSANGVIIVYLAVRELGGGTTKVGKVISIMAFLVGTGITLNGMEIHRMGYPTEEDRKLIHEVTKEFEEVAESVGKKCGEEEERLVEELGEAEEGENHAECAEDIKDIVSYMVEVYDGGRHWTAWNVDEWKEHHEDVMERFKEVEDRIGEGEGVNGKTSSD